MATLHVRNIPDELHARLQELAASRNLSLSAEVARLLEHALEEEALRVSSRNVLAEMRRRRFTPPEDAPGSNQLLREDRNR